MLDYVIARKNPLHSKDVILELHGSPLFAIRQKIVSPQTTEGTVILLGPLDFEMRSMYHLTILANVSLWFKSVTIYTINKKDFNVDRRRNFFFHFQHRDVQIKLLQAINISMI